MSKDYVNKQYRIYTITNERGIVGAKIAPEHRAAVIEKELSGKLGEGESLNFVGVAPNQEAARLERVRLKALRVGKERLSKVKMRRVVQGDWSDANRFVEWRWSTPLGLWLYV